MLTASRPLSNLFLIKHPPLFSARCRQPLADKPCRLHYKFSISGGGGFFNVQMYRNNERVFGNTGYRGLFAAHGMARHGPPDFMDRIMNLYAARVTA